MIKQKIILANILIKKTINTFLTPKYNFFYFNVDKKYLKKKKPNKNFFYFFSKLWFIPSIENSRYWMNVKLDDKIHGAQHYLKFTKNSKDLIKAIIKYSRKEDKILDLCCNVGRYLNYLKKKNYKKLYGVDINKEAILNTKKNIRNVNFTCSSLENYLLKKKNNYFDVLYTHGATLELVKPTFDVISEICRITSKYIIVLIHEHAHKYPRFWRYEFKKNKFKLVSEKKFGIELFNQTSLLVFKKN